MDPLPIPVIIVGIAIGLAVFSVGLVLFIKSLKKKKNETKVSGRR